MKKTSPDRSKQSSKKPKVRERARTAALPKHQVQPVLNGKNGSSPVCPKCKGFLVIHHTNLSQLLEIRCINCGWQPQWGIRTVGVSQEILSIRNRTNKMFSQPSLRLSLVSEHGRLE